MAQKSAGSSGPQPELMSQVKQANTIQWRGAQVCRKDRSTSAHRRPAARDASVTRAREGDPQAGPEL